MSLKEINKLLAQELTNQKVLQVIDLEDQAKHMLAQMKQQGKIEYQFYRGFLRAIELLREKKLLRE
jgi:hypothetical protein